MKFYILCKNEGPNIQKCIEALLRCGMKIVVLDSGSTDGTLETAQQYPVAIKRYRYTNHCDAYNEITTSETDPHCGILDADMELFPALGEEIERLAPTTDVLIAPIRMYVDGLPLDRGSLCPPKAIVFRAGKAYFQSAGHGERLIAGAKTVHTQTSLIHNDLKSYSAYLSTQARYADAFIERSSKGSLTWRDKIRLNSPLLILIVPLYSLFVKGGILSYKGWIYALDRMIAESVMYRQSLSRKATRR